MKRMICLLLTMLMLPFGALAGDTWEDVDAPITFENGVVSPAQGAEETPAAPRVDPANDPWPKEIIITVGGDCTLGCTETQHESPKGFDTIVAEKGVDWPFSGLRALFAADDLTLVNLEGPLTDATGKKEKKFNFKGSTAYASMLTGASVEAVNLANNHYADYGEQGKEDTLAALDAAGVVYCAQGATAIYETRGVKIGLIGNTFPYQDGKRDISADVKALRAEGCQIVLAIFHWGSEYEYDFNGDQRRIGRAAIKAGADAVIGHHPHVIQGIEKYEDTYILYSLGNLVFGGNVDPDDRNTYLAQLTFTVSEDGSVEGPGLKIIPALLTELKTDTDYRPVLAEGDTAESILKKILNRSSNMDGFVNPD